MDSYDNASNTAQATSSYGPASGRNGTVLGPDGEWAFCAKTSTSADPQSLVGNDWQDMTCSAIVPHTNFVNTLVEYVGNGRYRNLSGGEFTARGFVTATPHVAGLRDYDLEFAVGLWNGSSIDRDVGQVVSWPSTVATNVANDDVDSHTYEYELLIPVGSIWGFKIRRTNSVASDIDVVLRAFSHTVRCL